MKHTLTLAFLTLFLTGFSQTRTMSVYRNGVKIYETLATDRDSIAFSASDTVRDIDGNVYRTIRIGNKIWMVDNLRTTRLNDGTPIAFVTTANIKFENGQSGALRKSPVFCWHNNLDYNKTLYGGLYNWYAVGSFKLAPAGWRVSTKEDWADLEDYLAKNGYNYDSTKTTDGTGAKVLKSMASQLNWVSSATTGAVGNISANNNRSGLSLLPGALRDGNAWGTTGVHAGYWALSSYDSVYSSNRRFSNDGVGANQSGKDLKQMALSVRCVKDVTTTPVAGLYTDASLNSIINGLSTRLTTAFEDIRKKAFYEAPIDSAYKTATGVPMSRTKSYSLCNYAFKSLWLNIALDTANYALTRNADYYLTNPPTYMAEGDNFYWSADIWLKSLEYYGSKGSKAPGRITAATEARLYELMFAYMDYFSKGTEHTPLLYAEYKKSNTWDVYGSENHHAQHFYTYWHFAKFLKDNPLYAGKKFSDGSTPAQCYTEQNEYFKHWLSERGKKGMLVEMATDGYNEITLKGIYNVFDFATDTELRDLARSFIDLYWATWAQEELSGSRGGGKSRVYPGNEANGWEMPFKDYAYFYFNIGSKVSISSNMFTILTSPYRPPLVVADLALAKSEMGAFEIKQRALGLAINGRNAPPLYQLRQDYGGIVRYSYCTPSFIMGCLHKENFTEPKWTLISSQNSWQGIIFSGSAINRIYTYASTERMSFNSTYDVQSKGCMISSPNLAPYGKYTDSMRVCVAPFGSSNRLDRGGWTFIQYGNAYAAIKCVSGTFISKSSGRYLTCATPSSPVIVEVADKALFASYTAFQDKILALPLSYDGKVVTHTSIYNDEIKLFTDKTSLPQINGKVVDLRPSYAFDSPFIKSLWDSGIIEIAKNKRKLVLDFNLK